MDWQGNIVADIPWMFHREEYFTMDFFYAIYDGRLYFLREKGREGNLWISIHNTYRMPYYIEKEDLVDGEYEIYEAKRE